MTVRIWGAALVLAAGVASTGVRAASLEEFAAAYATATAHEKQAAANKNQWPAAQDALKEAEKAAEAKDFDKALALAKHADALAQASLHQSRTEETGWKDLAIR